MKVQKVQKVIMNYIKNKLELLFELRKYILSKCVRTNNNKNKNKIMNKIFK